MTHSVISRRKLIQTMLWLGVGGAALRYWPKSGASIKVPQLIIKDALKPSLEVFAALCSMVTLHDKLDPTALAHMYALFMDEPWAPEHISHTYLKLAAKLNNAPAEPFDEGEAWFISHLLTTWYLGIYYHEQRPTQRVLYEKALMFEAVKDIVPVPLVDATGFAGWTKAQDTYE